MEFVRLTVALCAISFYATLARADSAHLTLHSQPGDSVGQGNDFDIQYTGALYSVLSTGSAGLPFALEFSPAASGPVATRADLFFATDLTEPPIQPGTYLDAVRDISLQPGHPGLDVDFQGRGANTLTGQFTILDVAFYRDHFSHYQILRFSANFEQHSDGAVSALFGTFDYTASVPEPSTFLLAALALGGLMAMRWRRRSWAR